MDLWALFRVERQWRQDFDTIKKCTNNACVKDVPWSDFLAPTHVALRRVGGNFFRLSLVPVYEANHPTQSHSNWKRKADPSGA